MKTAIKLAVLVNNTLVPHVAFLPTDTQPCVLIVKVAILPHFREAINLLVYPHYQVVAYLMIKDKF